MRRPRWLSAPLDWVPDAPSRRYFTLSFALAVFLWAFTVGESKTIKEVEAPLDFINIPQGMAVVGADAHRAVVVQLKGPPEVLKRLRSEDVDVKVDLSGASTGPRILQVSGESVRLPSSVELVNVYPPVLHVSLDRILTASFSVRPTFTGRLPGGVAILTWTMEPPEAQVRGPQSAIRKIGHLDTQPINLDRRTESFQETVVPLPQDPDVSVVPGGGWTLRVILGEKTVQRTIEGIPVIVMGGPAQVQVEPARVQVAVDGPSRFVDSLTAEDFRVEVAADGLAPSEAAYELKPAVRLLKKDPSGRLDITSVSPHYVAVRVPRR